MRWLLPLLVLLSGCVGLDASTKTLPPGHDLDSGGDDSHSGSGDDSGPGGNGAPIADAGDDLTVSVDELVTLDGSGSADPDDDSLAFSWEIAAAPSGSSVTLLNADRVQTQLVPDEPGSYTIVLVVSDGHLSSPPDRVTVLAEPTGEDPVADAGPDQSVKVSSTVMLDGSESYDPDGDSLEFDWTLTTRPSGSTAVLSYATSPNPSFYADVEGIYEVALVVSDGTTPSAADTVRVTASADSGGSTCGCAREAEILAKRRVLAGWTVLPFLFGWRVRRRR